MVTHITTLNIVSHNYSQIPTITNQYMLVMFSIGDCFSPNMMQGSSKGIMPRPNKQIKLNFPIDGITHIYWTVKLYYLTSQHKLHNYVIFKIISILDYHWTFPCYLTLNFELSLKSWIQVWISWNSQCSLLL